jgi:glycosyltransferase involved in cell wall biosynthesis
MRIGFNALFLLPGVVGGSETLTRELLAELARSHECAAYGARHDDEFIVFCNRENFSSFSGLPRNVRAVLCPVRAAFRPARILYEQLLLPGRVARERVDVLFSPGCVAPRRAPCPSVVMVHDMQPWLFPQNFPPHYLLATRLLVRMSCRGAARVLTPSRAAADDLRRFCRVAPEKITPVHLGVNRIFFEPIPPERRRSALASLVPPGPFILTVSNSYPHKNLNALVRAFGLIEDRSECALVIAGPARRGEGALLAERARLKRPERVVRLRGIPFEALVALYQSAEVFALPSLYEGFGLPLIEAMAGGAPAACSDIPVFREVAAEAAAFFDPNSPEAIADALIALLEDAGRREELSRAGRHRAGAFTWEKAARETYAALSAHGFS